jgi:hypothetical protein
MFLDECEYCNPNDLEYSLYSNLGWYVKEYPYLLSFDISVAFSNPANKVQNVNNNRTSNQYDSEFLLQQFMSRKKIDYSPFNNFVSNGAHQEVDFDFNNIEHI